MKNDIFGSQAVAESARQLYAAAKASTKEAVEERLDEFFEDAARSEPDFETAFLATQMLRDLERITTSESVYVFDTLIKNARGKRRLTAGPSVADCYRARGETETAKRMERDPKGYEADVTFGPTSLTMDKPSARVRTGIDDPKSLALVSEHTLALLSATKWEDRRIKWNNFVRAIKMVSAEGAVRTMRELREVGALSASDYASLIDTVIDESVDALVTEDTEILRLSERAGVVRKGKKRFTQVSDEELRTTRRSARIKAAFLRRLGEHELANLLLGDLDAYLELVDESARTRV